MLSVYMEWTGQKSRLQFAQRRKTHRQGHMLQWSPLKIPYDSETAQKYNSAYYGCGQKHRH